MGKRACFNWSQAPARWPKPGAWTARHWSIFFSQLQVLKYYWGDVLRASPGAIGQITHCGDCTDSDIVQLCRLLDEHLPKDINFSQSGEAFSSQSILVTDPKKVSTFLLVPVCAKSNEEGIVGVHSLTLPESKEALLSKTQPYLRFGFWTHTTFPWPDFDRRTLIEFNHELHWSGHPIKEFRKYYVASEECRLKQCTGDIDPAVQGLEGHRFELFDNTEAIRDKTEYFTEWLDRGIRDSLVLRLRNHQTLDDALNSGKTTMIRVAAKLFDAEEEHRRSLAWLLRSVWAAAILGIGIDFARLEKVSFLFPVSSHTQAALWWTAMCILVFVAFLPPRRKTAMWRGYNLVAIHNRFAWAALLLFGLWTVVAFGINNEILAGPLLPYHPYSRGAVVLIIAIGLLCLVLRWRSYKWRPKA